MNKALRVLSKVFSFFGGGGLYQGVSGRGSGFRVVGSEFDYVGAAGKYHQNGVVSAIINYIVRKTGEARLIPQKKTAEGWVEVIDPLVTMIHKRPNEYQSFPEIIHGVIKSLADSGNAFLIKRRSKVTGQLVGYMFVGYEQMTAKNGKDNRDGSKLVTHYEYTPIGGVPTPIDADEVIHIKWGLDLKNPMLGVSPFEAVVVDIAIDNIAALSSAALLRNSGKMGAILIPRMEVEPPTAEQRAIIEKMWDTYVGDKSGKAFLAPMPLDVAGMPMTPEQLQLLRIREQAAARICAPLGIDVMTINLPTANKTYANYTEANESGLENCFLQFVGLIAEQMTNQTEKDLNYAPGDFRWYWDTGEMRGLQEDKDKKHKRVRENWLSGLADKFESRLEMGMVVEEDMRGVYYKKETPETAPVENK
jgi:HK97 family phage portal protein